MIRRSARDQVLKALSRSPVTALLGPRQAGKTTLARAIDSVAYFDLESVPDRRRLQNPELILGDLRGTIVLDEIQRMPELFEALRVLVDRPHNPARFLVLGSASPDLVREVSESLAGRIEFVELSGFTIDEIETNTIDRLWIRGGFPRSFLARSNEDSLAWRDAFIRTFLERDVPQLGITIPAVAMRRFWTMLAHDHAQTWNASQLARSMGLSDKTVRSYLDILNATFMVRQLQPWHENVRKRQVKAPKIYLRDSGILHSLLGIDDRHGLLGHPKVGASWEGFALEQTLSILRPSGAYFWATHGGAELDLLFIRDGKKWGIEFKHLEAPRVTKSMRIAIEDLGLARLSIVYPGPERYRVDERIDVVPLSDVT